jgi:hypothetical protein
MAIDYNQTRFLIECFSKGARFERTVTLGRLNFFPSHRETHQIIRSTGSKVPFVPNPGLYCEHFLKTSFGAQTIDSIDASAYEGATIVHDLNQPIDLGLHDQFDAVIDAGTIEHVANCLQAIRNCTLLVKPGGSLFIGCPANNFAGHGFYQISPDLWFRLLSKENGFEVRRMVAVEQGPRMRFAEIKDPQALGRRVEWVSRYPTLIWVWAVKVENVAQFNLYPQQSDYVRRWKTEGEQQDSFKRRLLNLCPRLCRFAERTVMFARQNRLSNRKLFTPL